jgi:hypothetical protein
MKVFYPINKYIMKTLNSDRGHLRQVWGSMLKLQKNIAYE